MVHACRERGVVCYEGLCNGSLRVILGVNGYLGCVTHRLRAAIGDHAHVARALGPGVVRDSTPAMILPALPHRG